MSGTGLSRLRILELVEQGKLAPEAAGVLLREVEGGPPARDEVAVVGMSGRFPDADDVEQLWANLAAGRDSVREMPAERWSVAEHWDADPQARDKTYSKWGAVLEGADRFDPDFFGISPREARLMDPQQRLFLMEAWRALEDAGYSDRALDGAACHVFVGAGAGDYHHLLRRRGVPLEGYTFMGTHPAVLASRISYHLNLRGPSLTVDTSCSSSLMAVHLACDALREGRCDMALAGGVAVLVTPELHVLASKAGMLSPNGRCRAFDDAADGFVTGEGVGAVVLKRLADALRDGDPIHGVIAATGANQDGRTNGITAPSGPAQTALIADTYRRFGIDPERIGYVECHGTGTRLGDPIEIGALADAFGRFTRRAGYCAVGSVKSNFGHALTAAGVAGLIKALLCLRNRQLVPTLHVEQPNRYIGLDGTPFVVNTALREWEGEPGSRMAAVSSFGFSGTNVHAVVREAPAPRPRAAEDAARPRAVGISAKTEAGLRERVAALAVSLDRSPHEWRDVAFTLDTGRSHFAKRAAFVARGTADLRAQLGAWLASETPAVGTGTQEDAAAAYRAGREVDWAAHFAGESCRRVSLPTYPFARESYWVPETPAAAPGPAAETHAAAPSPAETCAPAASSETSAALRAPAAGEEVVMRRRLDPSDPLVRDHTVLGRPLLPGAGHLEMVHGFLRELLGDGPLALTRVVFLRPLFVDEPRDVQVVVKGIDAGRLSFEVRTGAEVHSRGEAGPGSGAGERIAVEEVSGRCGGLVTPEEHYERFTREGIVYGPRFATVREVRHGDGEALSKLARTADDLGALPAGVLDGAVQSAAVLEADAEGVYLPFAMGSMSLLRPVPAESLVHVRKLAKGRCRIVIADRAGDACVVIEEFAYRELKKPLATELYLPEWRALDAAPPRAAAARALIVAPHDDAGLAARLAALHDAPVVRLDAPGAADALGRALDEAPEHVFFLGLAGAGVGDTLEALDAAQELGVRSLFRLVKALLARGRGADPLALTVVTRGVHAVAPGDEPRPGAAGLFGLCRSLAKEHASWRVACLDVGGGELADVAGAVAAEPPHPAGEAVVLRGGVRYAQQLRRAAPAAGVQMPYRRNGVFVIVGGAGGIGAELAVHLARRAAGRVALVGRRPAGAQAQATLRAVQEAGGEAMYVQADATDERAMQAAVAAVRARFGGIHGAFHSALVLRDARLETMEEAVFEAALAPKVRGTAVLARVLRGEPLDFLALFSSAQSFSGNAGQSNYSAACTFKDAYGLALRHAGVPVHVVNWGYWGEVGVVSNTRYRERMRAIGVHSISADEGMAALERVIGGGVAQGMALKAEDRVLDKFGVASGPAPWSPLPSPVAAPPLAPLLHAHARLDALGAEMVARALQRMGVFLRAGEEHDSAALAERLGVAAAHRGLWDTLLEMLAGFGYLRREGGRWCALSSMEAVPGRDLEAEAVRLAGEHSDVRPHAELLAVCLAEYPRLLTGAVAPTEVLFPGSSMHLVEGVYRGDTLADHLSELAARAARAYADAHPGRLRMLEVGAGTGGTTGRVLELIRPHGPRSEYAYTDLSAGFLRHGRRRFAAEHPHVVFETLDVERDPAAQGFVAGGYDVVIAANVLHATRDMANTLRHVRRLLKPGGWLVLNETVRFSAFATLTFGLLEGWWRWEDGHARIPGSPLLSVESWSRLLREAGFGRVSVLGPAPQGGVAVGQQVLVAEAAEPARIAQPMRKVPVPALFIPPDAVLPTPVPPRAPAAASRAALEGRVSATVARTLGRAEDDLDAERPFTEYGVDSILLVELVGALNAELGIELNATALFDHPSVRELAAHVATEYSARPGHREPAPALATAPQAAPGHAPAPRLDPYDTPAQAGPYDTPAHHTPTRVPAHHTPAPQADPYGTPTRTAAPWVDPYDTPAPAPLPDGPSRAELEARVSATVSRTLGRAGDDLDPERPFTEYGVDSILLVELVGALNAELGIELNATALFDHPTVRELAAHVAAEHGAAKWTLEDEDEAELALLEKLAAGHASVEETYHLWDGCDGR